jgi:TPR repeat protein
MTSGRATLRAIACSLGVAAMVPVAGPYYSAAHAQSADLVLCDRIAADPTDPDKPPSVSGVLRIAPQDIPIAIKFCKPAAAGSRRALYELGRAYAANGQLAAAVAAYRKAAAKGSTAAMVELATLLETGTGIAKDEAQAHALLQRAAAAGNPRALARLATAGSPGGGATDPAQERAMLTRAAEANSADAQFQLGLMYANGVGGPKDDVAARSWFEKAAAQNNPNALEWMGSFAANGRGGPRDIDAAKAYYARAAALGDENAKAQLKRLECSISIKDSRGHVVGCL